MLSSLRFCRRAAYLALLPLVVSAQPPTEKREEENVILLSHFTVSSPTLGATPGGAKDVKFFRMTSGRGQVPHPNVLTPEGLFSEHDLPLELEEGGAGLFRVQAQAVAARFEVLPEARYLAQLGLSSGLRADTWKRAPLNLVAVVDKSGSMSGEPLALVRASLKSALRQLRNGDQFGIVLYGDRSHVHLYPTPVTRANRRTIEQAIESIESTGSTNLEAGLQLGFEVARATKQGFTGNSRVMLFTDERPNVGDTSAAGFMALARAASLDGVGLTTIGVGVQFGAELATKVSSVRGGNLFFFPTGAEMKETFAEEFDTLVTEL
ncbi:MAG: VWA domain-containing protein, partial [Verrucomicrobiota bacterium]